MAQGIYDINEDSRSLIRPILSIITIILLGSVMVYGLNTPLSRSVYFIFVLLFFFFTKDNRLGISVLFVLALNPWGLFYYRPYDWLIPLSSTVGVTYKTFFIIIIFIKFLSFNFRKQKSIKDNFLPYYKFFIFYFIFLIIWGLVFGHSAKSLYDLLLSLTVFLLFIVLPGSFDYNSILKFNRIIFLFCLIHTLVSYIDILSSGRITNFIIFGREASTAAIWDADLVRLTGGIGIALYSMITGLYYLASRKDGFKPWFLFLVVITSFFYILNSATRGWMIASIFLLLVFFLFYFKRIFSGKTFLKDVVILVFFGLLILPYSIRENFSAAFKRLETVESITRGDITAGGTTGRWSIRGPRVLTRFNESPVFGFGFSKISSEYYDDHVGNHSLLVMGGIVGLTTVWITVLSVMIFLYRLEKKNGFYTGVFVFGFALMAIMIIHSTTRTMISYRMPTDIAFILTLLFNQINAQIHRFKYSTYLIFGNNNNDIKENSTIYNS